MTRMTHSSELINAKPINAKPINLALFGAGRWGSHLLRNFRAHPQVKLKAVVEASEQRLQSLTHELANAKTADEGGQKDNQKDHEIELLSDWSAALDLEGLDAVAIATPAATHYTLIEAALKKGLHVLAEKPLTLEVSSAQALCDLATQQNRQLVIDHTYLFHSAVTTAKANLSDLSSMGTPRYGYATRTHLGPIRRDVDALWDLAIHDISIFNYLLGETPIKVSAQGSVWLQPQVQTPLSPNGLADVVWCRLQYASGFNATIHLCWANPDKQRRLCLVSDAATLIFDEMNQASPLVLQQGELTEKEGWFTPTNLTTQKIDVPKAEPLANVCQHFVECVYNNQPSEVSSGQLGAELVAVLVALSESMNQAGQWVEVNPLAR